MLFQFSSLGRAYRFKKDSAHPEFDVVSLLFSLSILGPGEKNGRGKGTADWMDELIRMDGWRIDGAVAQRIMWSLGIR